MAKLSKKALMEFDQAIEQLGGGVAPVLPPKPVRRAATPRKTAKAKGRKKVAPKAKPKARKNTR